MTPEEPPPFDESPSPSPSAVGPVNEGALREVRVQWGNALALLAGGLGIAGIGALMAFGTQGLGIRRYEIGVACWVVAAAFLVPGTLWLASSRRALREAVRQGRIAQFGWSDIALERRSVRVALGQPEALDLALGALRDLASYQVSAVRLRGSEVQARRYTTLGWIGSGSRIRIVPTAQGGATLLTVLVRPVFFNDPAWTFLDQGRDLAEAVVGAIRARYESGTGPSSSEVDLPWSE